MQALKRQWRRTIVTSSNDKLPPTKNSLWKKIKKTMKIISNRREDKTTMDIRFAWFLRRVPE